MIGQAIDDSVRFTDDDAQRLSALASRLEAGVEPEPDHDGREAAFLRRLATRCGNHQRSCVVCGEGRVAGEKVSHRDGCPLKGSEV